MKNKKLIIIIVVVVIIILAVVLFLVKGKNTAQNQVGTQNVSTQENQGAQTPGIKESLLGLLQSTSGIKCSVTDTNVSYTVTAKGDKAKIEGINSINPQTQKAEKSTTMINDGTWAYIWSGQQGMKFNLKDAQLMATPGAKPTDWKDWATQMQNSGAKYDCQPGLVTDADFIPPTDITFQDLGALMKSFQQGKPTVPAVPK